MHYLDVLCNVWIAQAKAFLSTQIATLANILECDIATTAVKAH